jgi:hypothetical protein
VLTREAAQQVLYRVSALSGHGVEGSASQAREDLFQSGLAHYKAKRYAVCRRRAARH